MDRNSEEMIRKTQRLSILLGMDDLALQGHASEVLTRNGHFVIKANDEQAVIGLVSAHPFDVLLLGLEAPDLDGIGVLQKIRHGAAGDQARSIPAMALAPDGLELERAGQKALREVGFQGIYPFKLLARDDLITAVEGVARGEARFENHRPASPQKKSDVLSDEQTMRKLGAKPQLVEKLRALFTKNVDGQLTAIDQALCLEDHGRARQILHTLVPGLEIIGATRALALARRMQGLLRQENCRVARQHFQELEMAIQEVKQAIAASS